MSNNNKKTGKIQDKIYSNSSIGEDLGANPNCFENYNLIKLK